jgi:uncharacterized protein YndB with AHSA1/START domain
MPTDLIHRIGIAAPAEKIYRAITTEEGIQGWWTTDVNIDTHVGGKAVFGFFDHSTVFEMRIEELTPPTLVRWKCEGGKSPDWVGTTQEFRLEPESEGEVLLKFCHSGWERGGDHCYYCNTTWGHLMVCLKYYAERDVKNPYFT